LRLNQPLDEFVQGPNHPIPAAPRGQPECPLWVTCDIHRCPLYGPLEFRRAVVERAHAPVIRTAAIEGVDLPVEGTQGVQPLVNLLEQLGRQKPVERRRQRVAARGELLSVELPRGDIFLLADLRVARAQPRQCRPQAVARELRGRHSSTNLSGIDHDAGVERLLTRSGGVFVGGLSGGLNLLDQRSDGVRLDAVAQGNGDALASLKIGFATQGAEMTNEQRLCR
jgi:hypothetical protein